MVDSKVDKNSVYEIRVPELPWSTLNMTHSSNLRMENLFKFPVPQFSPL